MVENIENVENVTPQKMTIEQVRIFQIFLFAFLKDTILEFPNMFSF